MSVLLSSIDTEFAAHPVGALSNPPLSTLSAAICGLGGLGVMGLTRLLCEALLTRYPRVATTETRGIAQRRAPVCSWVRAGVHVDSALSPDGTVPLLVALEVGEALRAHKSLTVGGCCVMLDLALAPATRNQTPMATAAEVQAALEANGIRVVRVRVQDWLDERRRPDVLASSVAFGALCALLELPLASCEALIESRTPSSRIADNLAAFRWGAEQIDTPSLARFERSVEAARPAVTRSSAVRMPELALGAA